MIPAETLMTAIVVPLISILFWETGREMIRKIFPPKAVRKEFQDCNYRNALGKEKVLNDIQKEASAILGQGHLMGLLIKDKMLKEARREASRILQEAREEIEHMRRETLHIFQKEAAATLGAMSQHLHQDFEYLKSASKTTEPVINKYLANLNKHPSSKERISVVK